MRTNVIHGLFAIALLSGCLAAPSKPADDQDAGGRVNDTDASQGVDNRADTDAAVEDADGPITTTLTIDHEVWFAGWHVQLSEVAVTQYSNGTEIKVDATFENLREGQLRNFETAVLWERLLLVWQGHYLPVDEVIAPDLPKGQPGAGSLVFVASPDFNLDDATLLFGTDTQQRAVVPLGPEGQAPVSLEPMPIAVDQELSVDSQIFYVRSGQLDASDGTYQADAGTLTVSFEVDVTVTKGQYNVNREHFQLELPDGSVTGTAVWGTDVNELLSAGEKARNLPIAFQIPAPFDGSYVLVLREQGSEQTGRIPFTITGADAAFSAQ